MSTRQGFIGGYFNPTIKAKFMARAKASNLSNTELLEEMLTRQLETADAAMPVAKAEVPYEQLPDELFWLLNDHIINAAEETDPEDPQYLPKTLEILAARLNEFSDAAEIAEEDDSFDSSYEEYLSAGLTQEINTLLANSLEELEQEITQQDLFLTLARHLNERADILFAQEQKIELSFSREEWYYLQELLKEKKEESGQASPDLHRLIRYQLGTLLEETGSGFLWAADAEMVRIGEGMKGY